MSVFVNSVQNIVHSGGGYVFGGAASFSNMVYIEMNLARNTISFDLVSVRVWYVFYHSLSLFLLPLSRFLRKRIGRCANATSKRSYRLADCHSDIGFSILLRTIESGRPFR